jgi:hypothetical protein
VTDKEAAYPNGEWLCFVESSADRNSAEAAAMNALAQSFRVDIKSATEASRSLTNRVRHANKESISESAEYRQFAQNLTLFSRVSGLTGVEKDIWTAPDGTVYVNVRMNRAECSARYTGAIEENEKLIALLAAKAEAAAGTFEAVAGLNFSGTVAELTDNFYAILSVLRPETSGQRAAYGSAGELRLLKQEASRLLIVEVRVSGDIDGRIGKAFSAVFSERGFRTGSGGRCVLEANFKLEDLEDDGTRYHYVRFTLGGALTDRDGAEALSFSETDREGHLRREDARQRAVLRAERFIGGAGFAERFEAYLDSLL